MKAKIKIEIDADSVDKKVCADIKTFVDDKLVIDKILMVDTKEVSQSQKKEDKEFDIWKEIMKEATAPLAKFGDEFGS